MKKIFLVVALCVVIGCTGSAWAGAENTPGRYVAPSVAGGSAEASPTQAAMWAAAPAPEEESGLTWQQVMGIVMLCGGCCGGGVLWQKARQVKIEPQPLEVAMSKDYVTRSEFEDYRKQVSGEMENVHKRLDNVTPAVAQMQGKLDMIAANQDKILSILMTGRAAGAGNSANRQS